MVDTGQECLKISMHLIKMFAFFCAFFGASIKFTKKNVLASFLMIFGGTCLVFGIAQPTEWLFWRTGAIFLVAFFFFQGSVVVKIGTIFFLYVVVEVFDAVWMLGIHGFEGKMKWLFYGNQMTQLGLYTIIDLCVAFIIRKIMRKYQTRIINGKQIFLLCLVAVCDALALGCTQILLDGTQSAKVNNIVGGSMIGVCLLLLLFCVFQILLRNENVYYKGMLEQEQKYAEMQDKYYRELYQKNKEENKFRHDWKNHLSCLNALCEKGKFDEVKEYVITLDQKMQFVCGNIDCGNPVVSVLVSELSRKAQEKQVEFQVRGHIGKNFAMESIDICTLLSNMFNNALEACERVKEKKWIQLTLQYSEGRLLISLSNTMQNKEISLNEIMYSGKKNAGKHGYGMQNMQDVVQKYHGMMQWEGKENVFTVQVVIPE